MVKTLEGEHKSRGKKYAIVVARFNEFITKRLLDGALSEFEQCGVKQSDITIAWVPGSFELPVAAAKFANKTNIKAVVCLGAVIKGETIHFDLVAEEAARGIQAVAVKTGKPIIFGVLATDTVQQAYDRCEEAGGDNKGADAAQAAVEMANLLGKISSR